MKEAKSPLIASLLLTIKNNFSEGYSRIKTSTTGKTVVGFQTVDSLTVQRARKLTVMKHENHSFGRLKSIPKLI